MAAHLDLPAVYHLLDESEPFSERHGGAISRWVANVLKSGSETVVCSSSDDSWGYTRSRIWKLAGWSSCRKFHPLLYRAPWWIQKIVYGRVLRPLLRKLKRGDTLYIHNRPECAAAIAKTAPRYGVRVMLHMHNSLLHPRSVRHIHALAPVPVVFCSEFLRREVTSRFPNSLQTTHVVHNGADGSKFRPEVRASKKIPQIIFTGRLVHYKGVHVLLAAMRILEEKGIPAKCTIVGSVGFGGNKRSSYIEQLERMRPANTELVGYKAGEELARLLQQADIFCCPSIWDDPFPLAPLEAMAAGLPVVASRAGGIPEALAHGGGILVPPNDESALAFGLQRLLEDVELRQLLGTQAVQACRQHFLWENVRSQYKTVVHGAVS